MKNFKYDDPILWQGRSIKQIKDSYQLSELSILAMAILITIALVLG